ncbi:MAG TPA: polysaccharide biosynthesis/export family protein [Luteolibacter sp.]
MKKVMLPFFVWAGLIAAASAQTIIKPGQAIKIDIRGVPSDEVARVQGEYPVSESGTVNIPLIGPMAAAGMSPTALGSRIEAAYKAAQIYKSPTVLVIASSGQSMEKQLVHLGGQVRRTGPVDFVPGLTIYQAVQAAGGATEFGAMNRVQLLRGGKVRELNLKRSDEMNFPVMQNDTITVPEKNFLGQ